MNKLTQRLLLVLFGLLLFVGVEGALRLFWQPSPQAGEELSLVAIDPFQLEQGRAHTDPAFRGVMQATSFAVPKPVGRFRVFCLGGSTTMGYPSPPEAAWPSVLERRLRALYPDRDIEVINVGANSYGSGRLLGVLRGILKYEPDLLIVATGDTEFVEDSFRTAVALQPRKSSWLHSLCLSRMIKGILPKGKSRPPVIDARSAEVSDLLFSPMPDNTVYKVTDTRRQAVMTAMAKNLAEIVTLAQAQQIPLFLCTLPANLTAWAPDPDFSRPEGFNREGWEKLWQEGRNFTAAQETGAALQRFAAAAQLWDGNAGFCYEYGQLLLQVGKRSEARRWLTRARDLDPTPVRTVSATQNLVRQAASGTGIFFLDLAARFEDLTFSGTGGDGLLFDYAHPTPRGHAEIAAIVGEGLAGLPGWRVSSESVKVVDEAERNRAASVVMDQNADLSYVQGEVFERKGNFDRAEEMYRLAIKMGNQGAQVRFNLASVLARQGRLSEALEVARRLPESHPQWSPSFVLLGYLYDQAGQPNEALAWCQRALSAGETDLELFNLTGRLLLRQGGAGAARELLRRGLDRYPDDCLLLSQYGESMEAAKDLSAAEAHYRQVLTRAPGCQQSWEGLGLTLMNQERWEEAAEVFQSALRQASPLPFHHLNLGIVYNQGLKNQALAAEQFRKFLVLQPEKEELVPPPFRSSGAQPGGKH